jgi:hypothetical protein
MKMLKRAIRLYREKPPKINRMKKVDARKSQQFIEKVFKSIDEKTLDLLRSREKNFTLDAKNQRYQHAMIQLNDHNTGRKVLTEKLLRTWKVPNEPIIKEFNQKYEDEVLVNIFKGIKIERENQKWKEYLMMKKICNDTKFKNRSKITKTVEAQGINQYWIREYNEEVRGETEEVDSPSKRLENKWK